MKAAIGLRRRLHMRPHGDATKACVRQRRAFESAVLLVRVYYASTLYLVALLLPEWTKWSEAAVLAPRWPVAWIGHIGVRPGVHIVMAFTVTVALAAAAAPASRLARLLVALALLEVVSLSYSFGRIGSGWNAWLWTAFLFTLLPDSNETGGAAARGMRQRFLTVFWAAQVMLFGSFALSGAWKIAFAFIQMRGGEAHAFAPSALARHVAKQLLASGETSLIGPAIIESPVVGWLPFLAAIYLQLGAIAAAFRPSLHRIWAIALIAFHMATTLVFAMTFPRSVLLLAVLGAASPFAPARTPWRSLVYDMPLVAPVLRRIRRGKRDERAHVASRTPREAH